MKNETIAEFDNFSISPIHVKDAWRICDFMISNEKRLKRFFPSTLAQNLNPTLSQLFAQTKAKQFALNKEFLFVLKENKNQTVCGLVYLKDIDFTTYSGEIAYCIGYQYQGKGYTTKAVKTISNFAFTEVQLNSLKIIVYKGNIGSIKVALNCGYKWEQTLLNEFTPPNENSMDMELYKLYIN